LDSFLSDLFSAELTSCTLKTLCLKVLRHILRSDSRQCTLKTRFTHHYFIIKATFITLLYFPLESFLSELFTAGLTSCTLKTLCLKVLRHILRSDYRQCTLKTRFTHHYFIIKATFITLPYYPLESFLSGFICRVHIMHIALCTPKVPSIKLHNFHWIHPSEIIFIYTAYAAYINL
jgi:hypothetical protein